jgi:transcriptional regulator with XRE-family HTH domain
MTFGEYIKKLRKDCKLSQRDLAEKSGISNAEISRIESGERKNPAPAILKAIAPHIGVTYEELLQMAGYIEEIVPHQGYTEKIYRDQDGSIIDIVKRANIMHQKDPDWANLSFRVAVSNLPPEDMDIIKAQTEALYNSLMQKHKKK